MDFVAGLPTTVGGFDFIWAVVDRLTKLAYFIPVKVNFTADRLAHLYISQIVRLHGVPVSIISNRGSFHISPLGGRAAWIGYPIGSEYLIPPSDCPSDQRLPLAKFAYNNNYHSSIHMAPFKALYGRRCRSPIEWFDSVVVDTDLIRDAMEWVRLIQGRLLTAQSRHKSYADMWVQPLVFMVGDQDLSLVPPVHSFPVDWTELLADWS
ncbi:uncharacterized protein LOC129892728 [Solanum dulcamara]|uniref:uncharacterized protein LOC129892728 n=1 Tax=Solanum dulcamara TaxID=45834 RepID=UPI002484FEE8|nr:uncharacterized protein LOC129892728 [Solanum dulcamara]